MPRAGVRHANAYRLLPGGVAEVTLTRGQVTLVDAADLERVLRHRWYTFVRPHGLYYAIASTWHHGHRGTLYLHRYLLAHAARHTDHVNGDGLDNRRANLRPATTHQNMQGHRRLAPTKSSRFRGVAFDRTRGLWRACITVERRGTARRFATEEEAARWYDERAKELFGEFATLNFPPVVH